MMISCNVRPAYLGCRSSLYIQHKQLHSSKSLPTLHFRNSLLDSSHGRSRAIPAVALKIKNFSRRVCIAAGDSEGPLEDDDDDDKELDDSFLQPMKFTDSNKESSFNIKKIFEKLLCRALAAVAVLSSIALSLLALTPTLLSHPSGLHTALHLVNATVPAVTVEIDSVKAGWRRPLEINGIRILEKEQEVSTGNNKKEIIKNSNDESSKKRRELVTIEKIKSTGTLLDLSLFGRQTDLIIASPKIDVTMNEQGNNLRIVQALQDAGLSPLPLGSSMNGNTKEQINGELQPHKQQQQQEMSSPSGVLSKSWQEVTFSIPFSGEIRTGNIQIALTSGQFLAPSEFHELFALNNYNTEKVNNDYSDGGGGGGGGERIENLEAGSKAPQIHFEVLLGGETIEEEAQLEEQQAGFVDKTSIGNKEESSLAEWARQKPVGVKLPADVGYLTSPIAVRVDSNSFKCRLAGWRTSAGYIYLASPVEAEMNLTPKLARVLMNRLNPLLGDAVELRGSSKIAAWITPSDHVWPSARLDLQLSPLRLSIGRGAAIARGLEVLKLADRKIGAATAAATLQVDVSPLRAEIAADGKIVTKRVDLAVGVPGLGRPLHLVSYGTAHASPTGAINMVLAIPADALELAGITGLPDDFGVPIFVHGTVARPSVNLIKASKEVALLLIEAKTKKVGPRGAEWMWQELKLGGDRSTFRIPEE